MRIFRNKCKKGFKKVNNKCISVRKKNNPSHKKKGNLYLLRGPFKVVFDLDENGVFEFNKGEDFDLGDLVGDELNLDEKIKPIWFDPKKGLDI